MKPAWVTCKNLALRLSVFEADRPSPTVVFLHGMGASSAMFSHLVPGVDFLEALRSEGLNVVAVDFQGHGMSDGRRGHLPFHDALANAGEAVGFAVERFGQPVGLAGSGLGGFVAFYAGLGNERVGAVACHTAADLRQVGTFELRLRRRALASLIDSGRRAARQLPLVPLPLSAVYSPGDMFEDPAILRRWRRFPRTVRWYTVDSLVSFFLTPDDKPAVEAMGKPLYVITGERDMVVPLAGQEDLVARAGSSAELFVLGGAGHMLPLEYCGQTAPRMAKWLRAHL
ncbi:MAG: alpha/beta fold hydrolase [Actinomycetota bacterium]